MNLFLILSIKCHKYIGASILINLLRIKNCELLSLQIFKDFIIKLHYSWYFSLLRRELFKRLIFNCFRFSIYLNSGAKIGYLSLIPNNFRTTLTGVNILDETSDTDVLLVLNRPGGPLTSSDPIFGRSRISFNDELTATY